MEQAIKIMKKKQFIKNEADKVLSKEMSDKMWKKATVRLDKILKKYESLPKGVHSHTDSFIFPSAAIYLTAKEFMTEEQAYAIIENASASKTKALGEKLAKVLKLPLMKGFFLKMWNSMTKKQFGEDGGFKNRFYPPKKGDFRMDILACPYCNYFSELGCFELTKIFCDNDERSYGNLSGLKFERKGTLGKGAECCDFHLYRVKE